MKRCIKWLINSFNKRISKMQTEEKIGFAIGSVIGILIGIFIFVSIDTAPATIYDYELMEKQLIAIQQNPELLLKTDCSITVKNEIITVCFENDECKLIVRYDQNFKVLSTSKVDNYMFWILALGLALLSGILVYCISSFVVISIVFLIEILWKFIYKKIKSIKTNFEKR